MPKIRENPTQNPLDRHVLAAAIDFVLKADAMGILKEPVDTLRLDLETLIRVARQIVELGLGIRIVINPCIWRDYEPEDLITKIKQLSVLLEESPQPQFEWPRLRKFVPDDLLAKLTHVSEQSVRRYAEGERTTPDDVAMRLHWLALVVGDLFGAYNEQGVRGWFNRPRPSFKGKTPLAMLSATEWSPDDEQPKTIREFARSLAGGMGT